jgi:lantibiotic modifying enzyme
VLRAAAQALNEESVRELAATIEGTAAREFGAAPRRWPSGVDGGWNPTLMLGAAGVGYHFLRLADPRLPSCLLIGPAV